MQKTLITLKLLIVCSLAFSVLSCKSRTTDSNIVLEEVDTLTLFPYWIDMMNDSNVNYYDAVTAFDTYWENRVKPTEKDGEAVDIFDKQKTPEQKAQEELRSVEYVYEYKKFLNWKQSNKNLVKPDGTILTQEEILEQWEKQTQERTRK
jgi:hypothetical protein